MTTLVLEPTKIREGFTTVTPYVRVREAQIPEAERRASLDVERSSPGWTSRFMHHMSALTAAALLDARAREDRASL